MNWIDYLFKNYNPRTLYCEMSRLLQFSLKFLGRSCSFWSWLLKVRKVLCRVAYFCLMYICIPIFWWITSMPSSSLIYFAFSSSVSGIDAMGNWWEKPCIFHGVGYTIGWKSDGRKYPYFGESMGTNFPGSLNSMDFAAFSNAMGNWWGNLSISHVMKYITGWESGWRNAPILWEKYEYQFPRLSQGFCYIFSCYGKLMGKPMHFSYAEVYHRMGI